MKRLGLFAIANLFGVSAVAGEIFGAISQGDKPLPKGTKIEIVAADKTYTTETDATGGYRLFVPEKGKLTLKVSVGTQTPSIDVFSSDHSARYDLILDANALKRK